MSFRDRENRLPLDFPFHFPREDLGRADLGVCGGSEQRSSEFILFSFLMAKSATESYGRSTGFEVFMDVCPEAGWLVRPLFSGVIIVHFISQ